MEKSPVIWSIVPCYRVSPHIGPFGTQGCSCPLTYRTTASTNMLAGLISGPVPVTYWLVSGCYMRIRPSE
eukprot:gene24526-biopygen2155